MTHPPVCRESYDDYVPFFYCLRGGHAWQALGQLSSSADQLTPRGTVVESDGT